MKKTIEKTFCDDCGKEILWNEQVFVLDLPLYKQFVGRKHELIKREFCLKCVQERVSHSISIIEDRTCTECELCKGTGMIYVSKKDSQIGFIDGLKFCPECNKEK